MIVESSGVTFRARRATQGKEFLASTDNWFRPVNFANGPDGCLYMMDMYREVIEDPSALPDEILEHVDYYTGQDMGRIYRIVPDGFQRGGQPRLGNALVSELVTLLDHEHGWWRSTAHRLLYERRAADGRHCSSRRPSGGLGPPRAGSTLCGRSRESANWTRVRS